MAWSLPCFFLFLWVKISKILSEPETGLLGCCGSFLEFLKKLRKSRAGPQQLEISHPQVLSIPDPASPVYFRWQAGSLFFFFDSSLSFQSPEEVPAKPSQIWNKEVSAVTTGRSEWRWWLNAGSVLHAQHLSLHCRKKKKNGTRNSLILSSEQKRETRGTTSESRAAEIRRRIRRRASAVERHTRGDGSKLRMEMMADGNWRMLLMGFLHIREPRSWRICQQNRQKGTTNQFLSYLRKSFQIKRLIFLLFSP